MSQFLAAFGLDWKLLLIQAVNFGLLLSVLTYFLYRPILRIIDERRAAIAEGVEKAKEADERLGEAKTQGEKMIGDAAREAEGLLASARTSAEERGSQLLRQAEERAAATMKDAADRAEEAKRQALKESEREIARAAVLAAEKILGQKSA